MLETSRRWRAHIAAILAMLLFASVSCAPDVDDDAPDDEEYVTFAQQDLDQRVEDGLRYQLPPPLPADEQELYAIKLGRQQVADDMVREARAAMAPLAVAAAVFAPSGPADLLLSVIPIHKLGKAPGIVARAFDIRRRNKRSRELIGLHRRFVGELDDEARGFLRLAGGLKRGQRVALKRIHEHTGSPNVIRALMRKQLAHDADVAWIARLLEARKLDGVTVRRFTFDGDFVGEFTGHSASPSWRVLKDVVDNNPVPDRVRRSLAYKVTGLLGEEAAARMVRHPLFARKHLGVNAAPIDSVARGMIYGERSSFDIVAHNGGDKVLFIEVKNWAAGTWSRPSRREAILDQLDRHDKGADKLLATMVGKDHAVKLLMVSSDGFRKLDKVALDEFEGAAAARGWAIEEIPTSTIKDFGALIEDLR